LNELSETDIRKTVDTWIQTDILSDVEWLVISGGEPLLIKSLGDLISDIQNRYPLMRVSIYTGLGISEQQFDHFTASTIPGPNLDIHLSQESIGELSEFLRYGTKWDKWTNMAFRLRDYGYSIRFHSSISAASIFGLLEFLNWRKEHFPKSHNFMHHVVEPGFLNVGTLGLNLLDDVIRALSEVKTEHNSIIETFITDLLKLPKYSDPVKMLELRYFLIEFASRRNIEISKPLLEIL
jgi:hypothetical protein